jgi:hypothetical protein
MNHALKRIVTWGTFPHAMKRFALLLPLTLALGGCLSIKTHHTVDPIHINVDVNVKVDKALNDFFGDLDKKSVAKP